MSPTMMSPSMVPSMGPSPIECTGIWVEFEFHLVEFTDAYIAFDVVGNINGPLITWGPQISSPGSTLYCFDDTYDIAMLRGGGAGNPPVFEVAISSHNFFGGGGGGLGWRRRRSLQQQEQEQDDDVKARQKEDDDDDAGKTEQQQHRDLGGFVAKVGGGSPGGT
jgi:hypothetical protein